MTWFGTASGVPGVAVDDVVAVSVRLVAGAVDGFIVCAKVGPENANNAIAVAHVVSLGTTSSFRLKQLVLLLNIR